jgi:hypothetical protein
LYWPKNAALVLGARHAGSADGNTAVGTDQGGDLVIGRMGRTEGGKEGQRNNLEAETRACLQGSHDDFPSSINAG